MKKNVSPGTTALIIGIMAVIIGLIYWKGASPGARAEEIEKAIAASVIKPPPGWKPGMTVHMSPPGFAAPSKAPSTAPAPKPK